jgi:hypothetical protein
LTKPRNCCCPHHQPPPLICTKGCRVDCVMHRAAHLHTNHCLWSKKELLACLQGWPKKHKSNFKYLYLPTYIHRNSLMVQ